LGSPRLGLGESILEALTALPVHDAGIQCEQSNSCSQNPDRC
jgi:hypothetical protein